MLAPADDDAPDFSDSKTTCTHVAVGGLCGLFLRPGISPTELALCETEARFGSQSSAAAPTPLSCIGGCDLGLVPLPLTLTPHVEGTRLFPSLFFFGGLRFRGDPFVV